MGKALRYLGRLVRNADGKVIRGTDATCCCGGGTFDECDCVTSYVYECPGDAEALCCSAKQFDLVTQLRCETNSTVDPSAWGLPLFGYTSGLPAAPTGGVLLNGYFEYQNVLSVRCKDGTQRVRQFGSFRWGVDYYDEDGTNHADNGEITWDVPPVDSGALLVSIDTVHAPGYNPVSIFPPSSPDAVLESLLPPLFATQSDCVETYGVGGLITTVLPYYWVPTGFAVGGIQFTGTGTSTASCATRSSEMRFEWDFLGASAVRYGGAVQTWDFSETTYVYEQCDPDPCDPEEGL